MSESDLNNSLAEAPSVELIAIRCARLDTAVRAARTVLHETLARIDGDDNEDHAVPALGVESALKILEDVLG